MSAVPPAGEGKAGSLPDLPPLPDITDTSYMTAAFKAPPRNPQLSDEEDRHEPPASPAQQGSGAPARTANAATAQSGGRAGGNSVAEQAYEAEEARFMATYRNPLEEQIRWDPVKVHIPAVWWFFLAVNLVAAVGLVFVYVTHPEIYEVHPEATPHLMRRLGVVVVAMAGAAVTFALIRKPPFWNFLHLVQGLTAVFWGLGGFTVLSWYTVDAFFIEAVDAETKLDAVKGVIPVAIWFAFALVVPLTIAARLLPPWERRAAVVRFGAANTFWGAFCGVALTMLLPHVHAHSDAQLIGLLAMAILPIAGSYALGVAIALPVRWPVPRDSFLPPLLGFLTTAMGFAVFFSFAIIPDVKPLGRVVLTFLALVFATLGVYALVVATRASDPMREADMEGLVEWVDADVIHPDEHAFMCDEAAIHSWAHEALQRGVFLAARDFYRAMSQLAFTDVESERGLELADTVRITRRKLEAAGVPPRPDFMEFSEKPIFPDPLD